MIPKTDAVIRHVDIIFIFYRLKLRIVETFPWIVIIYLGYSHGTSAYKEICCAVH
jgi:hypothetical protein